MWELNIRISQEPDRPRDEAPTERARLDRQKIQDQSLRHAEVDRPSGATKLRHRDAKTAEAHYVAKATGSPHEDFLYLCG